MYAKVKYAAVALCLLLGYSSCSNEEVIADNEIVRNGIQLRVSGVSENIRQYSELYAFNGQAPNLDYFNHMPLNIERTPEYLKMDMLVGKWNFVLVGCNEMDIRPHLISPQFTSAKSDMPMWVTQPSGGLLPDVPEIRTALINGVTIVKDQSHETAAVLDRNVAKVRLVLKDGVGFKLGGGHTFSLINVPTSLSWSGGLYPNKTNPTTTNIPMTKAVTFHESVSLAGHQQSDTIDFIIPAHKSLSVGDISTHKISVGVKLITAGGTDYINEVEIPIVPQDNKILEVSLIAKGGIEVKVDVRDWSTVYYSNNIDMYTMTPSGNSGYVATYAMNMKQERNWWVTLEDPINFEFVEESVTFGQKTVSPVNIQVRRKTAGAALSTKLNLFISGLDGSKEQYDITGLRILIP